MGIKQLMKLLSSEAPGSFKETEKKSYVGRTIAFDASMALYAMLIQIRSSGPGGLAPAQNLTAADGSVTSHIQGFFHRTIALMSKGIRPIYVFDGKPPDLKINELSKRKASKQDAAEKVKEAQENLEKIKSEGEAAPPEAAQIALTELNKQAKRTTRVTSEHNEDVQKLLSLMGLPVVIAPGEAEAQCAELVLKDRAFAAASEDMDLLTFGAPVMLRKLTLPDSVAASQPPLEIHLDKVLKSLDLEMDQFIDLCILLGCDYAPSVKGIGPKKGYQLIKEHKRLETVASAIESKYPVPQELLDNLDEIRNLFKSPEVTPGDQVKIEWKKMNESGLLNFLVDEKGFNEERVRSALKRLTDAQEASSQKRIDSFFKVKSVPNGVNSATIGFKRDSALPKKKPRGVKRRR